MVSDEDRVNVRRALLEKWDNECAGDLTKLSNVTYSEVLRPLLEDGSLTVEKIRSHKDALRDILEEERKAIKKRHETTAKATSSSKAGATGSSKRPQQAAESAQEPVENKTTSDAKRVRVASDENKSSQDLLASANSSSKAANNSKANNMNATSSASTTGAANSGGAPAAETTNKTASEKKDGASEKVIQLTHTKRISLNTWKGNKNIDIREYYQDGSSGEWKPGKKGITLSRDAWTKLKDNVDEITSWWS